MAVMADELSLLIEEQRKDDTYMISRPNEISLDSRLLDGHTVADMIGVDEDGHILDFTPRAGGQLIPGQHGLAGYTKQRCRCVVCRAANAKCVREHRARKRAEASA